VQEAEDAEGVVTVDALAWLGPQALFVSATLHPVEDVGAEMVNTCLSSLILLNAGLCTALPVVTAQAAAALVMSESLRSIWHPGSCRILRHSRWSAGRSGTCRQERSLMACSWWSFWRRL